MSEQQFPRRTFLQGLGLSAAAGGVTGVTKHVINHANADEKNPPDTANAAKWGVGAAGATAATLTALGAAATTAPVQRAITFRYNKDFEGNKLPEIQEPSQYRGPDGTPLLNDVVSQKLQGLDGDTCLAWCSKELTEEKPEIAPGKKVLLFFPGNAGHLGCSPMKGINGEDLGESTMEYIKLLREAQEKGYLLMAVNNVGYAGHSEPPTQDKMYSGAEMAVNYLLEKNIRPSDIRIAGVSMGTPIAAHAAAHLSQSKKFAAARTQNINLLLINGYIDFKSALKDNAPGPLAEIINYWPADRMDTAAEFKKMAEAGNADRINVTFLRGKDDAVTPAGQIEAHREAAAAAGLNFTGDETDGKHYPDPATLLERWEKGRGAQVGG